MSWWRRQRREPDWAQMIRGCAEACEAKGGTPRQFVEILYHCLNVLDEVPARDAVSRYLSGLAKRGAA